MAKKITDAPANCPPSMAPLSNSTHILQDKNSVRLKSARKIIVQGPWIDPLSNDND
jgi:hypothetical protein